MYWDEDRSCRRQNFSRDQPCHPAMNLKSAKTSNDVSRPVNHKCVTWNGAVAM